MAAHECEGTGAAGAQIVGGHERNVGREDFSDLFVQQFIEAVCVLCDIADWFTTETQRGIIAFASGMLDEQQGGGDFVRCTLNVER